MGTIYTIACHDCKVKQDMDKWYNFIPVDSRAEALRVHDERQTGDFRAILAVSFLYKHNGHRIEVQTDYCDCEFAEGYAEPVDYWIDPHAPRTAPNPKDDVAPASGPHVQRVVGCEPSNGEKP